MSNNIRYILRENILFFKFSFVICLQKINNLEKAIVRCRLQHWAEKYSDRITLAALSENIGKPLFSEQEELLKSIPLPVRDNAVTRK